MVPRLSRCVDCDAADGRISTTSSQLSASGIAIVLYKARALLNLASLSFLLRSSAAAALNPRTCGDKVYAVWFKYGMSHHDGQAMW